jgi:cGMP-dependent protein kinase
MAPEVMLGKGYSLNVDLYALGVITFELLCGGLPFGEDTDDPLKIYEEIMEHEVKFPRFITSATTRKFVT